MRNPLYDFARKWIDENVQDILYPNMAYHVFQLVNVISNQRHSEHSVKIVLRYLFRLMEEYLKD